MSLGCMVGVGRTYRTNRTYGTLFLVGWVVVVLHCVRTDGMARLNGSGLGISKQI